MISTDVSQVSISLFFPSFFFRKYSEVHTTSFWLTNTLMRPKCLGIICYLCESLPTFIIPSYTGISFFFLLFLFTTLFMYQSVDENVSNSSNNVLSKYFWPNEMLCNLGVKNSRTICTQCMQNSNTFVSGFKNFTFQILLFHKYFCFSAHLKCQ